MNGNDGFPVRVRPAQAVDLSTIVQFNLRLAQETEGKALDLAVCTQGVRAALADPDRLRYWVAEQVADGALLGQAAVTREWSDWRCGWIWWFQSVYVRLESRHRGIFRRLHQAIHDEAHATPDVVGLRLYVEHENHPAQRTYESLGMRPGGYLVYETIWPKRFVRPLSDPQT